MNTTTRISVDDEIRTGARRGFLMLVAWVAAFAGTIVGVGAASGAL